MPPESPPEAAPHRQPKSGRTAQPAVVSVYSFGRALAIFIAITFISSFAMGLLGFAAAVERLGAALVVACVLTPVAEFLINSRQNNDP
jgi:hypothetical protein